MPTTEPEIVDDAGVARKMHYGNRKQPWDSIVEQGWGAQFAAGNVLKYVRRAAAKNGEDDIAKANWYFARLHEMAELSARVPSGDAAIAARRTLIALKHELTGTEAALLKP